jgi:opacity protein-like surface antigen
MRLSQFLPIVALPLLAGLADAQDDREPWIRERSPWYLQFGAGATFADDSSIILGADVEYDVGLNLSGLIGYQLGHLFWIDRLTWALEIESFYAFYETDKETVPTQVSTQNLDTDILALFLNGMVDWKMSERTSLYFGVGIGFTPLIEADLFDSGFSSLELEEDNVLAFQGKVGLRFWLGEKLSWGIGYRYVQTEDLEVTNLANGSSFDVENSLHAAEVTVRWTL